MLELERGRAEQRSARRRTRSVVRESVQHAVVTDSFEVAAGGRAGRVEGAGEQRGRLRRRRARAARRRPRAAARPSRRRAVRASCCAAAASRARGCNENEHDLAAAQLGAGRPSSAQEARVSRAPRRRARVARSRRPSVRVCAAQSSRSTGSLRTSICDRVGEPVQEPAERLDERCLLLVAAAARSCRSPPRSSTTEAAVAELDEAGAVDRAHRQVERRRCRRPRLRRGAGRGGLRVRAAAAAAGAGSAARASASWSAGRPSRRPSASTRADDRERRATAQPRPAPAAARRRT